MVRELVGLVVERLERTKMRRIILAWIFIGAGGWGCQYPAGPAAASDPTHVGATKNRARTATQAVVAAAADGAAAVPRTAGTAAATSIRQLVGHEELILQLTPRLKQLTQDAYNLTVPGESRSTLFDEHAEIWPLGDAWQSVASGAPADNLLHWSIPVADSPLPITDLRDAWHSLFEEVLYVEHAKFAIVRGEFTQPDWSEFTTTIDFHGLARRVTGTWLEISAQLTLAWRKTSADSNNGQDWKIIRFRPEPPALTEAAQLRFREISRNVLPDAALRNRVHESQHWIYATRHYYPKLLASLPGGLSDSRFFPISTAYHPALAVVDIDQDGWDDLYVVDRWGKNILLRNRGNGTFHDVAAQYGLDIEGRSNAAVFADFDNDGDPDLMLARSLERSQYFVNEQGRFVDRSAEQVSFPMPMEAASVSVADYNRDGLLDVYFTTYHQDDISRRIDADLSHPEHRIHQTLTPPHSAELKRRFRAETRSFLNQVGPPNILLTNRGHGRFELAAENAQVAGWRNAFQASWNDYDQDGDPDLYVANDFAADHLYRNDGEAGFHDVTQDAGFDQIGFAMGASWGDYDNDGRMDLYVSNMYSKAGQRITSQIDQLDPRIGQLANGNYLWRNEGTRFRLVSGLKPPSLLVARAGWSWGGQFFDADNDGWLDLYVPNGYYTVPEAFETNVDL